METQIKYRLWSIFQSYKKQENVSPCLPTLNPCKIPTNYHQFPDFFCHLEIVVSTTSTTPEYGVWDIWDTTEPEPEDGLDEVMR